MGMRLQIPAGNWHVKIFDGDSGTNFFDADVSDTLLISLEKFFVNWAFMLWRDRELVFKYRFNPKGQRVHFMFLPSGMGDRIALFPYAEDFTGNLPLVERANLLAYADFFIGMTSGLSWLAWATNCPAILIGGITPAWFEFATPYRVINRLVCFGCHNDISVPWAKFLKCPRHKDTDRAYECSRKISARQVIQTIDRLIADKRAGRFSYPNFL